MNLKELSKRIPFKWRVQSFSKNKPKASCVAYIDARQAMDLLDEVVGVENWQSDYKVINGNLYAGIAILINGNWVWKWDCGTESNTEKEKGESSDAFKRAAVKWGVGRFLYSMNIQYVDANEKKTSSNYPYVVDANGKRIWNLTDHLNKTFVSNKVDMLINKPVKKVAMKAKKEITDGSPAFENAVKGIKEGKVKSISDLEKYFTISDAKVKQKLEILLQAVNSKQMIILSILAIIVIVMVAEKTD